MTAHATYQGVDGGGSATGTSTTAVPYPNLAATFDNTGITDDTNTDVGNIDGSGSSMSPQALAAAGVTAGAAVSHAGLSFTWLGAPVGTPDNTLAAGQPVQLAGTGSTLGLLLTASYGPASGTGTVLYIDGTRQPFTLTAQDWYSTTATGDVAITTAYRNRPGNTQETHTIKVFYDGVPLQDGKAVSAVVRPNVGTTVASGTPLMHVFAMTLG